MGSEDKCKKADNHAGMVISVTDDYFDVQCGIGILRVLKVNRKEEKRWMYDFCRY